MCIDLKATHSLATCEEYRLHENGPSPPLPPTLLQEYVGIQEACSCKMGCGKPEEKEE